MASSTMVKTKLSPHESDWIVGSAVANRRLKDDLLSIMESWNELWNRDIAAKHAMLCILILL